MGDPSSYFYGTPAAMSMAMPFVSWLGLHVWNFYLDRLILLPSCTNSNKM